MLKRIALFLALCLLAKRLRDAKAKIAVSA
jgi:hypothetical protein